ncbi:MAG TPA: NIPSNAP family protein [Caulobacteraceae bacterium]|nr:NIPSNAP family protein [Caulobacteraceae bacterium]
MSTYLHVTLEVKAAGLARFMGAMGEAVPILEAQGWKLAGAFVQRTGRLNTVIDLWELDDFGHFDRGLKAFLAHPSFAGIKAVLDDTVLSETIVFADKAPYMRQDNRA